MTARQPLEGTEIQAAIDHINDDHTEELLYSVRAFTPHAEAEQARLTRLFADGFEVECLGERLFIPFMPAATLEEAMRVTSLEAMKRLGVWPPRRVAHWTVEKNERLGASFRRLHLNLNGDDRSDWRPGDCCRFDVAEGEHPRPYTLRKVDGDRVLVDVFCHENSSGTRWVNSLAGGSLVKARGERHELFPDFTGGEAWLLGDETALPTIAALLEGWTLPYPVHVLLEVADKGDREYLADVTLPPRVGVTWLSRQGVVGYALQSAVKAQTTSPAAIWAATEVSASIALKKVLKSRFPAADVKTIGYWRGESL